MNKTGLSMLIGGIVVGALGMFIIFQFLPQYEVVTPTFVTKASTSTYNDELIDWMGGHTVDYLACESDNDCILIDSSECGCPYSARTAINKTSEEVYIFGRSRTFCRSDIDDLRDSKLNIDFEKLYYQHSCDAGTRAECVQQQCQVVLSNE